MDYFLSSNFQLAAVLIVYVIIIVCFGIYQGKKVKSSEQHAIAGRTLPGWVAALSERATGESSWCLLGLPGFAYAVGLSSIWTAVGCVLGIIVAWVFLAGRLRQESEKYDAMTFMDYLEKRHPGMGKPIRVFGSVMITFFFFFYVGSQFLGGGKTLSAMFDFDPAMGAVVACLVIIPYTVYGGFASVVYTDCVQAILMITALVFAPIFGLIYIANHPDLFANSITSALSSAGPEYVSMTGGSGLAAVVTVVTGLSWFFGYLGGTPQLTMRFMAIKDDHQAKLGRNIGVLWTLAAYIGAFSIGWIGIAMFGPGSLADPETVMPRVMLTLFPTLIAGLFIVAALAAMFSTADSLLVLTATELSEGIIKPYYKGRLDEKKGLKISRIITCLTALVALGATFALPSNLIFTIVGYVWAAVGCPFSAVILLTLFWKRFNSKGAFFAVVVGMIFTIVWVVSGLDSAVLTARVVTFFVSLIVGVLVSLMTAPEKEPHNNAGDTSY